MTRSLAARRSPARDLFDCKNSFEQLKKCFDKKLKGCVEKAFVIMANLWLKEKSFQIII